MTIRNKLIVYAMTSILLALLAAGLSIDLIITDLYNKSAREELSDTYKNLNQQLSSIKNDMLAQTLQIAMNDSVVAITNMVDNYQDKNHYQPLIFDNDKKKTAAHLLNQIALTQSNHAAIYDKNGDLIAYATNNDQEKLAGISSFHNGKPVYIEKKNHDTKWTTTALPDDITPQVAPLDQQTGFFTYPGEVNYTTTKNQLIIENMRTITRTFPQGKIEPLGTVRVSKPLDETFFKQATNIANKNISLILHNGQLLNTQKIIPPMEDIKANALLYGDTSPISTQLLTTHTHYTLPYVWPTPSGNNYLLITLSRSNLTSALNSTRLYLTIAFSIIASITIITGIYWLNRLISRPLDALVQQAKLTDENHYPVFPINQTKDEINLLGTVLNKMVNTIKSREKDLTLRTKQLDNAQRISHIGDWELDHATDTMTWSDEQYRIFELDPATCKPSRDAIQMVIHPDDVDKTLTAFETSIKEKKPFVIIHRIMTKDMRIKFVRVYGETLYDEEGTAITSTGTMQDITEQTIKDEQLRRTQKMDALGKLTGGIAHDFNNMLGVIAGFTELLQLKFANNDQKANIYIKEIFQASERARKLTAKLLSFSRKDISSSTKTDINQLLHEEQHMLEKTLTVRIALKFNLEKDLWPVKLDRDELEDAIINMSINAMHAIPESGELVLSTKNISLNENDVLHMEVPAGDYVLLSISDTGTGMDYETIQRIFEPFFTTKDKMGTGLGMSQVYGFVKRSNGDIHIYSEPGHGTQINIYFPRHHENISSQEPFSTTASTINLDLTGNARILVVDDEAALQELAYEILTSNGYSVFTASNGRQALQIIKKENIDLILSDVIMPEMNGYELATKVRESYPLIKIQMVSGYSDIQDPDTIIKDLYENRLRKPFSSTALLSCIKKVLA